VVAGKVFCIVRDQDLRAEFFCLIVGSCRELLPRDAGGESKVVLDSRARSRLAAGRARLDDEHVQSFRRAVHSCCQAGESAANDDDVAQLCLIDRIVEAEAVGDLVVCRIPENRGAAADENRNVALSDLKAIEELLHAVVTVEIDVRVRISVAREEFLHTERSLAVSRSDQDDVAVPLCDELDAAQNERPHEDVAELAITLQQVEQLVPLDFNDLAAVANDVSWNPRAPGECVDLSREHSGLHSRSDRLSAQRGSHEIDRS
jgi:hypothetical protein